MRFVGPYGLWWRLSLIQIPAALLIAESANVVFGLLKTLLYFAVLKNILKWI